MSHNFRELNVWQKACDFTSEIYKATSSFPKEEIFGLSNQLRRAAVSIPSNIAEGCGLATDAQLSRHLAITQGSACEIETQLIISNNLNFLSKENKDGLLVNLMEIQKMIFGLKNSLKNKASQTSNV